MHRNIFPRKFRELTVAAVLSICRRWFYAEIVVRRVAVVDTKREHHDYVNQCTPWHTWHVSVDVDLLSFQVRLAETMNPIWVHVGS